MSRTQKLVYVTVDVCSSSTLLIKSLIIVFSSQCDIRAPPVFIELELQYIIIEFCELNMQVSLKL